LAESGSKPNLIVTRTPLRLSFAGGGTDLAEYYERDFGAVLSTAVNQYLYVTLKPHGHLFDEKYRLNYSENEQVDTLDNIKNDIARECLRLLSVDPPIYISTVSDVPASSGLGSSSSFAVGLLNALHALRGERPSAGRLAEEAAHVEIDVLKRPIGKQDHYAAAFGGLNYFCFLPDGRVTLEPQHPPNGHLDKLFDHVLMFSTGIWRDAGDVLTEQKSNTSINLEHLTTMRSQAQQLRGVIQNGFRPEKFGEVMDAGWQLKRQLATGISNDRIDTWYQRARDAGAWGGKLAGAGGGGFLALIAPPDRHNDVRRALSDLKDVRVSYESQGSRLLLAE
jgi:D-glycero-alpha-D-manno-heptose-7-phosphate kinase